MNDLIKKCEKYLCPPGNGVYTVHTAKELKSEYHKKLYNEDSPAKVEEAWREEIKKIGSTPRPRFCLESLATQAGAFKEGLIGAHSLLETSWSLKKIKHLI